ncbi:hypothetical protein GCM10010169_36280 [Micromonospora fulviviridis]|nr:hypothetical protein GCM10010169_36280 [Micromonospora fulviviridis]
MARTARREDGTGGFVMRLPLLSVRSDAVTAREQRKMTLSKEPGGIDRRARRGAAVLIRISIYVSRMLLARRRFCQEAIRRGADPLRPPTN